MVAAEQAAAKRHQACASYDAATSALIGYKFRVEKDFLLAAIVLYKYFEIVKPGCSSIAFNE